MNTTKATNKLNFFKKLLYCTAAFMGFPFLITLSALAFIDVNKADNSAEVQLLTTIITITYTLVPIIILLAAITWQLIEVKRKKSGIPLANQQLIYYCILSCRYLLSAIIIFYGLDKLMVNQLNAGYYWYGDELGKLTGFQLTWSFFGYSKIYTTLIALAQVFGGLLLLFRRTTLLGAVFLLPILINIALIDYNYDIPAKDIITALLLMDIFLVSISIKPLLAFFIRHETVDAGELTGNYSTEKKHPAYLKPILVCGVLLFAFFTNYKQVKTTQPNPFEGAWDATSVKNYSDSIPEKNKKLTLRLFVDGTTATLKKTYQYQDFTLAFDSTKKNFISMIDYRDSLHSNDVTGNYTLIGKDRLLFEGMDGKDSVSWTLKKTSH